MGFSGKQDRSPISRSPKGDVREALSLFSEGAFFCLVSHLRLWEKTALKIVSLTPPSPNKMQPHEVKTKIGGLVWLGREAGEKDGHLKTEYSPKRCYSKSKLEEAVIL